MDNTQKQVVAYYRVSSKRQRDEGVSIEAQRKLALEYAMRCGYTIVKEYAVDESAKRADRKIFTEMTLFVRQNEKVVGILAEKVDRLLRGNFSDIVIINDLVQLDNKEVHFIKESLILSKDSKSAQKFHFDIHNAIARNFLNNLSDEVRKSYDVLVDDGFYPHLPPLGYESKLEEHIAIIDTGRELFIKKAFELCATGEYSEKKISQVLYQEGFRSRKGNKVGKSSIGKILHDPFYYGYFRWKGEINRGNHDKIINKDLFDKVQEVLSPKNKKSKGTKHNFAFTGLMKCGECGNGITAELQKGHVYYHCTKPRGAKKCSQKFVREEIIEEQFEHLIKSIALDLKKITSIKEIMRESVADESEYLQNSLEALNSQYNDLQGQSSRLLDLYLKGKIKDEAYTTKSTEINKEIETINNEIAKFKGADRAYFQEIEGFLTFCNEAPVLFKSSRAELKRELLRFVVSNLFLKDKKLDFSLKVPFNVVALYSESENWQGCTDSNCDMIASQSGFVDQDMLEQG